MGASQTNASESQTVSLETTHFRICLDFVTGTGDIFHRSPDGAELQVAQIRYLAAICVTEGVLPQAVAVTDFRLYNAGDHHSLEIECHHQDALRIQVSLTYADSSDDITIVVTVESVAKIPIRIGLRAFCIDMACETIRARFAPALYSGWTYAGRTLSIFPVWHSGQSNQMSACCDFVSSGDIRAEKQGIALNLPSGMVGGMAQLDPSEIWHGAMVLQLSDTDIWNPQLATEAGLYSSPLEGIQPPRHSFQTHICNWQKLAERDDVWVPLGDEMGMYHRGYYGMIRFDEARVSGPLRYRGYKSVETGTEKLVELAWGGSNNTLLAYTLFHASTSLASRRARDIMTAVTQVNSSGFQIQSGPCKTAWHNGYYPEEKRFADRYDRNTIYTPDQGITNYFLAKTLLEELFGDPSITSAIRANCFDYLLALKNEFGGLDMAQRVDGSPGIDRYELPYDGDMSDLAMPTAMGALSFLMYYRLTGEVAALEEGYLLLQHVLKKVESNDWRFHEYDTWGWDSAGISWILTALCEWSRERPEDVSISQATEKTLRALLSCQHKINLDCDHYSDLERCWGGRMVNRGGFVFGSSVGSIQGVNSLHNRYDPALALWTHFQLTGDARSYTALLEFLNYLTYHQWTRENLTIGLGAVSEAMHFTEGHVQDTAQMLHSNCLHHILLQRTLFLESSTATITHIELPYPNGKGTELCFHLESNVAGRHRITIGGVNAETITLSQNDKIIYTGSGRDISVLIKQANCPYKFTACVVASPR